MAYHLFNFSKKGAGEGQEATRASRRAAASEAAANRSEASCSNLGVRWGAVTDGRQLKLYDAPMRSVCPEDRLVLSINLADYNDRDDFETRIYPQLELIATDRARVGCGTRASRGAGGGA